eukprot:1264897-Rhodomonas_salina.2
MRHTSIGNTATNPGRCLCALDGTAVSCLTCSAAVCHIASIFTVKGRSRQTRANAPHHNQPRCLQSLSSCMLKNADFLKQAGGMGKGRPQFVESNGREVT